MYCYPHSTKQLELLVKHQRFDYLVYNVETNWSKIKLTLPFEKVSLKRALRTETSKP